MNAIELDGVEKRFGRVRALAGISLAIAQGQRTLVTGANGAGKSTLLRVLAALTRPTRGSVRILGVDPFRGDGAAARARVGYLGSDPALYGDLTVEENLHFCARVRGLPPEQIREALAQFGLEHVRERRVRALSAGFRRRAGLARATLGSPELLLLDEPWNGLDAEAGARLRAWLERARARGATALVAAHASPDGEFAFDRIVRLDAGALAAGALVDGRTP